MGDLDAQARGALGTVAVIVRQELVVLLMGTYDVGYQLYASSVLQGALQKAGRDSTIEGAGTATSTIDQRVTDQIRMVVPNATLAYSRKAYATFGTVSKPEDFTDVDSNGTCAVVSSVASTSVQLPWFGDLPDLPFILPGAFVIHQVCTERA